MPIRVNDEGNRPCFDCGGNGCRGVVYQLPCECGARYVGQTARCLAVRAREHEGLENAGDGVVSHVRDHKRICTGSIMYDRAEVVVGDSSRKRREVVEAFLMLESPGDVFSAPSITLRNEEL